MAAISIAMDMIFGDGSSYRDLIARKFLVRVLVSLLKVLASYAKPPGYDIRSNGEHNLHTLAGILALVRALACARADAVVFLAPTCASWVSGLDYIGCEQDV